MGVLGLSLCYVLLAVLLLGMLLRSPWPLGLKAAAVVLTSVFYIVSYFSLYALTGWPSSRSPPSRFQLIAAAVREPESIFLWVLPLSDPGGRPRSHALPYDRNLHEEVRQARERLRSGRPQMGEHGPQKGDGSVSGAEYRFTDLPGRYLPPKP